MGAIFCLCHISYVNINTVDPLTLTSSSTVGVAILVVDVLNATTRELTFYVDSRLMWQ